MSLRHSTMKENKTKQKKYLFELAFIASSKVCPQTSLTYPGDVFHLSSPARASDCIVDEVTLIMSTAWRGTCEAISHRLVCRLRRQRCRLTSVRVLTVATMIKCVHMPRTALNTTLKVTMCDPSLKDVSRGLFYGRSV